MRARGWLLVVTIALGAGAAMPAGAADEPRAPVVARDGDVSLRASGQEDDLCIGIGDGPDLASEACGDPADGLVLPSGPAIGGVAYLGVATPNAAARVEVRRAGLVVGRATTVAGAAYEGPAAGTLRFALVRLARGTRPSGLRVHLLDAVGVLLTVLDAGRELVFSRTRLLSGRAGSARWSLVEERTSELAPLVGDPAHEKVSRCVRASVTQRPGGSGTSSGACTSGSPADEAFMGSDFNASREEDRCDPGFRLLHGVVGSQVRRVTVTLGDGRRRSAATKAVAGTPRRVWAIAVGAGDAVRVVALAPADGPARLLRRELAPLVIACSASQLASLISLYGLTLSSTLPAVTPVGPVTALAGSPSVRIADGPADTLCLALGDRPFDAGGCDLVTPLPGGLLTVVDDPNQPRAFAVAVPSAVVTVRLLSAERKVVLDVPAVEAPGYTGRYAGRVRFAASAVPAGVEPARMQALDATGKDLLASGGIFSGWAAYAEPAEADPPRRVAGRPGAPSLWQTRVRYGDQTFACLRLTSGPPPPNLRDCQVVRADVTVLLAASCATRRLTAAVGVRAGTRVLVDSDTATRRPLRLRAGAGLVTLAPTTGLRSLTFVRRGSVRRVRLHAPPGSRQCGWRSAPLILPPR